MEKSWIKTGPYCLAYISTFMYPASRTFPGLREAIESSRRHNPFGRNRKARDRRMVQVHESKRLGPSFIPAEILVPLEKMDSVFEEIEKRIKLPVLTEGMVISDGNVVLSVSCVTPSVPYSLIRPLPFP